MANFDLTVVPEMFPFEEVTYVRLTDVSNVWMVRPGLSTTESVLTFEGLARCGSPF